MNPEEVYSITRTDAADTLHMSTRTIDRYIRSGKIRSHKIGKIIYLHGEDIENLRHHPNLSDMELSDIAPQAPSRSLFAPRERFGGELELLYHEAKEASVKKDEVIRDLSYRLGVMETDLRNSVPVVEHKKTTFLLESAKTRAEEEREHIQTHARDLEEQVQAGMRYNLLLSIFLAFLLIIVAVLWIRLV